MNMIIQYTRCWYLKRPYSVICITNCCHSSLLKCKQRHKVTKNNRKMLTKNMKLLLWVNILKISPIPITSLTFRKLRNQKLLALGLSVVLRTKNPLHIPLTFKYSSIDSYMVCATTNRTLKLQTGHKIGGNKRWEVGKKKWKLSLPFFPYSAEAMAVHINVSKPWLISLWKWQDWLKWSFQFRG